MGRILWAVSGAWGRASSAEVRLPLAVALCSCITHFPLLVAAFLGVHRMFALSGMAQDANGPAVAEAARLAATGAFHGTTAPGAGAILAGLGLAFWLVGPLCRSGRRLADSLKAGGAEFAGRAPGLTELMEAAASAMHTLRDGVRERELALQDLRDGNAKALARYDQELVGLARTHHESLSALERVAPALWAGAASAEMPQQFAPLADILGKRAQRFRDGLSQAESLVHGVVASAGQISRAADDLSKRTEQQAATLEETAAALDEITTTVKKSAEGASQANLVVAEARTDAEKSGEIVRRAVSAMGEIESSAKQISRIIGVIDEIAFQTNLLALNAGVEAARAGDAGRGFAVVASEVRALAQRSADAAKEIKSLISESSAQVETGVELVGQTGEALERIVDQVSRINTLVAEISASSQEQSTGLSQVNTAVNQMDQVTQQNAAMVEQSTAASHALAKEATELASLIRRLQAPFTALGGALPEQEDSPALSLQARLARTFETARAISKSNQSGDSHVK